MNRVKDNIIFLQAVATLPKKQVKELLRHAEKSQLKAIGEVSKNILTNNLKPLESYKTVLKRDRWVIRSLADDRTSYRDRLKTVIEKSDTVTRLVQSVLRTLTALTK
jgi:CRISPR/Cas system-associated protein Cas10 (large subunit of type III CRISPR-Cas system)